MIFEVSRMCSISALASVVTAIVVCGTVLSALTCLTSVRKISGPLSAGISAKLRFLALSSLPQGERRYIPLKQSMIIPSASQYQFNTTLFQSDAQRLKLIQ
jgi:hypothetical protein